MAKSKENVKQHSRTGFTMPPMYKVIVHNDDVTTFEFVEVVMQSVFNMSPEKAASFALLVDREGKAVAGVYTFDIARTKTNKATDMAREANFPLVITYERE